MKKCLALCVVFLLVVSVFGVAAGSAESEEQIGDGDEKSVEDSDDAELQDLADSSWPSFSRDRKNTGRSPYDTSHVDGTEKWSFETGDSVLSSPAIGEDGTIYVGSTDDNLYAVNPDGTEKWSFETGDNVRSSPAIGEDGTIYVGSTDDNLYAVNPDGTEKWIFETGDNVRSVPAVGDDGTIYVGSLDDKLYAVNPDGTEKWSFETGGSIISSPAIGEDGTIYVGSTDDNLYAIGEEPYERTLTIGVEGEGTTDPSPGTHTYDHGEEVTIEAIPDDDWVFTHWEGDYPEGEEEKDEITITMDEDKEIIANFEEDKDPIQIHDWYDLDDVRDDLEKDYILMNDLDERTDGYDELIDTEEGWEPIGYMHNRFSGTFDGQGYEIRDLYIDRPNTNDIALFGFIDSEGEVRNVGVVDANVSGEKYVGGLVGENKGTVEYSYLKGDVSGDSHVGGLVGLNYNGTVENSYAIGDVSGEVAVGGLVGNNRHRGTIEDSYATGEVNGEENVGGLVGYNGNSTVENSYATGKVSGDRHIGGLGGWTDEGSSDDVPNSSRPIHSLGGLVGWNSEGTVENSYAIGDVSGEVAVGGLVGNNRHRGTIEDSYATGEVNGEENVGGLVGWNYDEGTVENSYATGGVSGDERVGGLVGHGEEDKVENSFWDIETSGITESEGGTGKTTAEMKDVATYTDTDTEELEDPWDFVDDPYDDGGDEDIWDIDEEEEINDGYPFLTWEEIPDEYELTVHIEGGGTVEVNGQEVYDGWTGEFGKGEEVELVADADDGWVFDGWTGDYEDDESVIEITIDEDKEITAHFTDVNETDDLRIESFKYDDFVMGRESEIELVLKNQGSSMFEVGELEIETAFVDTYNGRGANSFWVSVMGDESTLQEDQFVVDIPNLEPGEETQVDLGVELSEYVSPSLHLADTFRISGDSVEDFSYDEVYVTLSDDDGLETIKTILTEIFIQKAPPLAEELAEEQIKRLDDEFAELSARIKDDDPVGAAHSTVDIAIKLHTFELCEPEETAEMIIDAVKSYIDSGLATARSIVWAHNTLVVAIEEMPVLRALLPPKLQLLLIKCPVEPEIQCSASGNILSPETDEIDHGRIEDIEDGYLVLLGGEDEYEMNLKGEDTGTVSFYRSTDIGDELLIENAEFDVNEDSMATATILPGERCEELGVDLNGDGDIDEEIETSIKPESEYQIEDPDDEERGWLPYFGVGIIALIVLVIAGILVKKRGKSKPSRKEEYSKRQSTSKSQSSQGMKSSKGPPAQETSEQKSCPDCGGEMRYIEEYDSWYCDNCQEYK